MFIDRREAEIRQKQKASTKKAQAEASRKSATDKARIQLEKQQTLRSSVFSAARCGEVDRVKKGIWEDNVDAAGGEVKKGCEEFIKVPLNHPLETLMHIIVLRGDVELVKWLDTHGEWSPNLPSVFLTHI